jgi:arylsulfatase
MPLPKRPEGKEHLISYWNRFQNRYKYMDKGMDDNLVRVMKAAYYSSISFIDYNLGRLFDHMKTSGIYDDTLIIFTADHGEMLGDYDCVGKRNFLDPAARIPLIMSHPDLPHGKLCSKPVNLVDILPTFLDYADIVPEDDYNGDSLISIVNGETERTVTFGQYQRSDYAMYMGLTEEYKYIYSAPDQKEWLFDLKTDPEETRNKAYNPMYINKRKEMQRIVADYFISDGYKEPFDGHEWKKGEVKDLNTDPDAYLLFQDAKDSIPHIPGYERDILDFEFEGEGPYLLGF